MATEVLSFLVNLRAKANEYSPTYQKYYADDTQCDFDELFIELRLILIKKTSANR